MKYILEKLKTDFIYETGAKYIGIIKTLGVTFASRLSEFTDKLKYIEKNRFITTAEKKYLYLHGGSLVETNVAKRAEGAIEVYGTEGIVIEAGTVFVSNGVEYLSVREETIGAIGNCSVIVKAKDAGSMANRDYGEDITFKIITGGADRLARVISIPGGTDDETEDEYRKRVKDFIANPQAPFNENNIKSVISNENRGIKYIWVKGGDFALGKVKIYAINYSYSLSVEDISRATNEIRKIKPPQLRDTDIEIISPIIAPIDVVITGVTPPDTKIYEAIARNVKEFFEEDNFEKGISQKDLERVIYKVNAQGTEVEDFVIESGTANSELDTIYKLNSIEVS